MLSFTSVSRGWWSFISISCVFLLTVLTFHSQLREITRGHPPSPGEVRRYSRYAQVAESVAQRLLILSKEPFAAEDFAVIGDRIAKYSRLAEALVKDDSIDESPLMSLLRKDFPWWQPLPPTYVPWRRTKVSKDIGTTGLVICAGSHNVIYAMHLIRTLRHVHKSNLPIQVAYAGDRDLRFRDRVAITDLGPNIETLNLLDNFDEDVGGLRDGGWAAKPFAMLVSRFQRVIIADADAIFLRSPDHVFDEEPGLVETGTLFWHDRAFTQKSDGGRHDWVRKIMAKTEPSAMLNRSLFWNDDAYQEMDSAVLCMDKGRPNVFMSLLFTTWMNTQLVRDRVTYKHVHGDKETFWLASELSHSPYHFVPYYAGIIGHLKDSSSSPPSSSPNTNTTATATSHRGITVCGSQALAVNSERQPFWFNGSLFKRKSRPSPGKISEFAHLTHWVPGAEDMASGLNWELSPSCLKGGEARRVEKGSELEGTLREIFREAARVVH